MAYQAGDGATIGEVPAIDREEILSRLNDPLLVIVDVLDPALYAVGHIPGARNLPLQDFSERAAEVLPERNAEIALYCLHET